MLMLLCFLLPMFGWFTLTMTTLRSLTSPRAIHADDHNQPQTPLILRTIHADDDHDDDDALFDLSSDYSRRRCVL